MNRVLGELQDYEFFNTGMQNRYAEAGESYRIIAGSNTAASIDETTGKMLSAGHAFCKARKGDENITIGYSSGSKIWSSSYCSIPDYIRWCDENGRKIVDSKIVVKTNTNYDLLPIPQKNMKYPSNTLFCFLSEKTYLSPPLISIGSAGPKHFLITDLDIKITAVADSSISVEATLDGISEDLVCDLEGNYSSTGGDDDFIVQDGRSQVSLSRYLSSHPLIFRTADDATIRGTEIFTGAKDALVFSPEHITAVDWSTLGTNVKNECSDKKKGKSIQNSVREVLTENAAHSHIVYDHGTGEIADYITFGSDESTSVISVGMFHVKAMKGSNYNSNVGDVYEVSQQAIKSTIWIKDKNVLLDKIIMRIRNSSDKEHKFIKGDINSLKTLLRGNKKMEVTIYIVQPAISKGTVMEDKVGEILAAATHYVKRSGRAKELQIWGSR